MTTDEPSRQWPYQRVAAALRERIASGAITGQLPSIQRIEDEFGVATGTVERALAELKAEGLIESVPDLGTFVRRQQA